MMMKKSTLLVLLCLLTSSLFARGYNISVEVPGLRDSTMYLAVYSGEKQFAIDTAILNTNGKAVFLSDEIMDAGMYLVIMNKSIIFDILISDEGSQHFSVTMDSSLLNPPVFNGSPENTSFYAYHAFKNSIIYKQQEINKQLRDTPDKHTSDNLSAEAGRLRKTLTSYSDSVANEYKGKTIASVLNALNIPEPPEINIPQDTPQRDSIMYMHYYSFAKDHFFDRIAFSDERLVRTPFFESMLLYYFDNVLLYQQADSIIPYVDRVIEQAGKSELMFRYVLSNLFNHYMESKKMGQEAVAVHLAERYYLNDKRTNWENEKFIQDITNFVNRTKLTLLGETAPDLLMETFTGQYESVLGITADFLIVYFFEPNCGYCKTETPKVYEIYSKYKDKGVQAYAMYTQQDKNEWTTYIAENGLDWVNVWDPHNRNNFREKYNVYITPQLYLLDKDKKVIGRRLDADTLDKMLTSLTKAR